MTKQQFKELIKDRILVLDGATGSNLMEKGMPVGVCPEQWILENPEKLIELQVDFIESGSNIIYSPTFTCNSIKLKEYNLGDKVKEYNTKLVELSRKAIKRSNCRGYIAGNMTMTGKQIIPIGNLKFEELVDVYKEQARALIEASVDMFVIETMMSLSETRAAVIAIKEINDDIPILVTLTFNEDNKTLFGSTPEAVVVALQSLGVDAVGANCSTGPKEMIEVLKKMKKYANIPLIAKPNAGIPMLVDGITIFPMSPKEFALEVRGLVESGADIVGGCCGSTPKHIMELKNYIKGLKPSVDFSYCKSVLSSERSVLDIDLNGSFKIIGERINPTGKKAFQAELKEGKFNIAINMATEQAESGASILDINMGMNGIDEKEMMIKCLYEIMDMVDLPVSIDSSYIDIIDEALRIFPGRCIINSISLEEAKCRPLMKIAKKYGAMCILLPLSDKGLPESIEEKVSIINKLVEIAIEEGLKKEDLVVDGLVATVGANKNAAIETLEVIDYCKNVLKIPTTCGLSNISFGLPERMNINTAFLTMAICKGLTMAIANPCQTMLMNAAYAADLLVNKDDSDMKYINNVAKLTTQVVESSIKNNQTTGTIIFNSVVSGNKMKIVDEVKEAIKNGKNPQDIVDEELIPAINRVGELFEEKKYFLPQLIASANAMDLAIDYLSPLLLDGNSKSSKGTVVMATVEGDIHDIGKNLVVLMLKNYGYNVIDLGKDVPSDTIVSTAILHNADIIGLSALMTTTMVKMKEVVTLAKSKNIKTKIIIGGACITSSYAKEIAADGYSKDAADAVKLVDRLLGK